MGILNIAKRIFEAGNYGRERGEPDKTIIVVISKDTNEWNKAAISLAEEISKRPSLRNEVILYPRYRVAKPTCIKSNLSTPDWNALAISNVEESKAEKR